MCINTQSSPTGSKLTSGRRRRGIASRRTTANTDTSTHATGVAIVAAENVLVRTCTVVVDASIQITRRQDRSVVVIVIVISDSGRIG